MTLVAPAPFFSHSSILHEAEALAHRMADEARTIIRPYFRTRIAVDQKKDDSPVTIADREIEVMMRERIGALFPDHGIRGEEFSHKNPDADWIWHLDPIDGTKSFLSGSLCFGTQVALAFQGQVLLGLIDQPITSERWSACRQSACQYNGTTIAVSGCKTPKEAILYTSDPALFKGEDIARFEALRQVTSLTRYSHDCYAAGLLAMGQIDILIEYNVHPYDIAAMIPIITQAGGIITNWQGNDLRLHGKTNVIAAATPELHSNIVQKLTL